MAGPKMTKNQMRRAKKKEQKKAKAEEEQKKAQETEQETAEEETTAAGDTSENGVSESKPQSAAPAKTDTKPEPASDDADVTVETLDFSLDDDSAFAEYRNVFSRFGASFEQDEVAKEANAGNQGTVFYNEDDDIPDEEEEKTGQTKMSRKKRKQMNKLSVAELKSLVSVPEVVDWQDVSSSDPRLLVIIKAQRNVVPVPAHWSLKREYLSSKRGIEKPPFKLPQFIADTGITEMRDAVLEKQAEQTLKQKQRERVQPKMGKLDIDYQKLYDAFFRFQTKPPLSRFGEVYYEGKESEVDYAQFRAGELGDETKEALGMSPGNPPPWLINQQRFGPPPSYPSLRIQGLTAPIPAGGQWGFHPGGWGKPPVDEHNRPLYGGDVFGISGPTGTAQQQSAPAMPQEPIDRTLWGELQPQAEESEAEEESEEEEDEEDDEDQDDETGRTTNIGHAQSGLETPGGYASVNPDFGQGVETSIAGEMDLRKERRGIETEESSAPRSAYTILPERQVRAEGFFGSDRTYDIQAAQRQQQQQHHGMPVLGANDDERKRKRAGDVDVSLDLDAMHSRDGIDKEDVRRKFEDGRREEGPGAQWAYDDDLSEMIAQESRKRQRTDKERTEKKREGRNR